jgi:transposase
VTVLYVRSLTEKEEQELRALAHSRTAAAALVQRSRLVLRSVHGELVPAIAPRGEAPRAVAHAEGVCEATVRKWLCRFNQWGVPGLHDRPRAGRPPVYGEEERGQVIALALTPPKALGEPFGCWSLERLEERLSGSAIRMKRSQIRRVLRREHVQWQRERAWFESPDPAFADKRGTS